MRLMNGKLTYYRYLLRFPSDLAVIKQIDVTNDIIYSMYSDLNSKLLDGEYLIERAILAPTYKIIDVINERIISSISTEKAVYLSAYSICKILSNHVEEDLLYLIKFLSSLKFAGLSNHELNKGEDSSDITEKFESKY